ncbi:MAG: hypothetical protein ACFE0Q_00985 [Anaerolineae bacterium]
MTIRRLTWLTLVLMCLSSVGIPITAQTSDTQGISLRVDAGYNNFYRPGYWLPLQIQAENAGAPFVGRLAVRPETSGRAVTSAYSVPIDLPTGSNKTVFLYVQAQPRANTLIVELIDEDGVRFAEQAVGISTLDAGDTLHMVLSGSGANSIPLGAVTEPSYQAHQARWDVAQLPPNVSALQALDTLIVYDVQSDQLTPAQVQAIEAWLLMGGHLIVIGGPGWAQTYSGLSDAPFMPFRAQGTQTVDDLSAFAEYLNSDETLDGQTLLTTGTVTDESAVRIRTTDGDPLLVSRDWGTGVVDYLTVDPTQEPLSSWERLSDLWYNLLATRSPEPGWQRGWLDIQDSVRALAILPAVELLPPVSNMIAFIVAYILLIGPVNYFLLSRIRRRALAWVTIPLVILTFTLLAWNVGFTLRGNEVIVSRLYAIQSFADSPIAHQEQLIGVLSPRRETYTIEAPDNTMLNILPGLVEETIFSANVSRTTTEIRQGQSFSVPEIAIDGGIFANFSASRLVDAPAISGQINFDYQVDAPRTDTTPINQATPHSLRGVVRNDSDITLEDVVIVTRNHFYRVEGTFAPGDVLNFDTDDFERINLRDETLLPIASPVQTRAIYAITQDLANRRGINESLVTARLLLGLNWSTVTNPRDDVAQITFDDEEMNRRRAFLRSFLRDQYATNGIGERAYLFGWTSDNTSDDIRISDIAYQTVDSTMHIIELDTEHDTPPSSETVTLSADQFTWTLTDVAVGQYFGSFNDLTVINPGWAEFTVRPLESAVLTDVSTLLFEVNRGTSLGRQVMISFWNWETQAWESVGINNLEDYRFDQPQAYLGRDNAVRVRVEIDARVQSSNANGRVLQLRLIQIGNF